MDKKIKAPQEGACETIEAPCATQNQVRGQELREPLPKIQAPLHMKVEAIPLKILEVRKQDVPDGRLQKLIAYRTVLRGLVNYHKRMTSTANSPEIEFFDDCYLGAIEESLNLIEKEIERLDG